MKSCAQRVIELLEEYGADKVFGIPGVHTLELYRALRRSTITHVSTRHEQAAGFAADAYARVTGRPGVCMVISGPGLTNLATAMAQAYADSIPMLVISAAPHSASRGSGGGRLHEMPDQRAFGAQVSAFSYTVTTPAMLDQAFSQAFSVMALGRPRPVHIEIPIDVLQQPAQPRAGAAYHVRQQAANAEAVRQAIALLERSARPLILAGGGALDCAAALASIADKLNAPVFLTTNAKGLLAPEHPLLVGSLQSTRAGRALIEAADVVMAVGTELGETDYDVVFDGGFAIRGSLIRIDIDPMQLSCNHPAALAIAGAAGPALLGIDDGLGARVRSPDWGADRVYRVRAHAFAALDDAGRDLLHLLDLIHGTLPDAIYAGDSTQLTYIGNLYHNARAARRWFNSATGFGTLGYGLPAAIGAALAAPDVPVVALIGDGGLMFTLAELATAVEQKLPVIIVLWNNGGYGEIKRAMIERDVEPIGVDLHQPNFQRLSESFECSYDRPTNDSELLGALTQARERRGPTLIELVDSDWRGCANRS